MSDTDTKPFQPINLAQDHYASPATGLSTEKGDSWLTVQQKINAGFKHVYALFGAAGARAKEEIEAIDSDARKEIDALREEITALQIKLDAVLGKSEPATAADPEGKPATGGEPIPASTAEAPAPNPAPEAEGFKAPGSDAA